MSEPVTVEEILHKELTPTAYSIVRRLRDLRDEIKGLRALEAQAKAELTEWLGIASVGTVEGEPVVRLDRVWRESFDLKTAMADPVYAPMIRACSTTSSYTTVRLV